MCNQNQKDLADEVAKALKQMSPSDAAKFVSAGARAVQGGN